MQNCQELEIGLGAVHIPLPFCCRFENRICERCQETGRGIQGQVPHPTYEVLDSLSPGGDECRYNNNMVLWENKQLQHKGKLGMAQ